MRNLFLLIFLIVVSSGIILSQNTNNPFVINSNNKPATYLQWAPSLFTDGDKGFMVTWNDLRKGEVEVFAQKFNPDLSFNGSNFLSISNELIEYSTTGKSLALYTISATPNIFYDQVYVSFLGVLFDDNEKLEPLYVGGGIAPWCGTGWPGSGFSSVKDGDEFLTVSDFGGKFRLTRIYPNGTDSLINYNPEVSLESINKTTISINKNGYYLLAYFLTIDGNDSLLTNGINIEIYNNTDSLIIRKCIKQYDFDDPWIMWPEILATSVSDSLFQVFTYDSLIVTSYKINTSGNVLDEKKYSICNPIEYFDNRIFTLSNYNSNNKRALIVNSSSGSKNYKTLFYFDKNGNEIGDPIIDSTFNVIYNKNIFLEDSDNLVFADFIDYDIYLLRCNNFSIIDSIKVNDDIEGSNEKKPRVQKGSSDNFYVTWQNEVNSFGSKISNDGSFIATPSELASLSFKYFSDGTRLQFWKKEYYDNKWQLGFIIFDSNNNVIAEDSLANEISSTFVSYNFEIINDSEFIVFYYTNGKNYLAKYSKEGIKKKVVEVPRIEGTSFSRISIEDDFFFLVITDLYKYDYDLNLISQTEHFPYYTLYVGDSKFLIAQMINEIDLVGSIYNSENELVIDGMKFTYKDNHFFGKVKDNQFLYAGIEGNQLTTTTYNNNGEKLINKFVVHNIENEKIKDINFGVSNNNILFAWSGLKLDEGDYDIYGVVYDLDLLTNINENNPTDNFKFELQQNYPNPFNPSTTIKYSVPINVKGETANVKLTVYDVLGREVTTLVNTEQRAGNYEVIFDASVISSDLTSGVYFYKLQTGNFTQSKKMLLLK